MTTFYVAAFVMGVAVLGGTLLVGDIEADTDGLPFLSLTALATAVFGVGTGGLIGRTVAGPVLSVPVAVIFAFVFVLITRGLLLPYILAQQGNSHISHRSYVGRTATVTIEIPAGGWGEVEFLAPDGSRVRMRAVSEECKPLTRGAQVYIGDTDADRVQVVAITK